MDRVLGAVTSTIVTLVLVWLIWLGIDCELWKGGKGISECGMPEVNISIFSFIGVIAFLFGMKLGFNELINQATAHKRCCPYCGTKYFTKYIKDPENNIDMKKSVLKCGNCGNEFTKYGKKI